MRNSMKFFITVYLLSLSVLGISQEYITIESCRQWARENYPLIRQHELIRQAEQFNLENAGKGYLPQVGVNVQATLQSEVTRFALVLPGVDLPELSKDQYQAAVEINQHIWDGGVIRSGKQVVKARADADIEQLESDLYTLKDRVNQLYFGVLLQNELLKQNVILQEELGINLKKIDVLIKNGVANRSDQESMMVELLDARQKAMELEAGRMAYCRMLGSLTGKVVNEHTRLQIPVAGDTLLSVINRPELNFFAAQKRFFENQSAQVKAGTMPRIGFFLQGGYGRPGLNMLEDRFKAFAIGGFRLSWNLGSFYTLNNDRRKIENSWQGVDVQRETFLFNTELQLLQQNTEIHKMEGLIQSDAEIVRLRSNIKQAAEVKLENGVISVTDLIREINAEDRARQTGAIHRMQRLLAICNYHWIYGL